MQKGKEGKSKLCWNCEGRLNLEIEVCHYCGVSVQPLMIQGMADLSPVYAFDPSKSSKELPEAPYEPAIEKKEPIQKKEEKLPNQRPWLAMLKFSSEYKSFILPLAALHVGTVFFFFSLALLFFSTDNFLTLQWSSSYWYIYLSLALLLLFIGVFSLQNPQNDKSTKR